MERQGKFLVAGLAIVFVLLAGCSDRPVPRPDVTVPPAGPPLSFTQKIPATLPPVVQTSAPVMTPSVFRTPVPQSFACPAGYVQGDGGDTLCYAQCNPKKRCRNAGDFCCGSGCCPQGSVCCEGNCYPGPCECSGGQCLSSYYEKPGIVVNPK